jgi:hypothetical protein
MLVSIPEVVNPGGVSLSRHWIMTYSPKKSGCLWSLLPEDRSWFSVGEGHLLQAFLDEGVTIQSYLRPIDDENNVVRD